MTQLLSNFIINAGWLAPLYYVSSFLLSALLPIIPTPLIGALGGKAFGFLPAVIYGVFGLSAGAYTALVLARRLGRPLLLRFIKAEAWNEWEQLIGIRSVPVWGIIFFVLNLDFAVFLAGLTGLSIAELWLAAMIARFPWLVISAWFGDAVLVSDTVMWIMLLLFIPGFYGLQKLRPRIRHWLVILSERQGRRR